MGNEQEEFRHGEEEYEVEVGRREAFDFVFDG